MPSHLDCCTVAIAASAYNEIGQEPSRRQVEKVTSLPLPGCRAAFSQPGAAGSLLRRRRGHVRGVEPQRDLDDGQEAQEKDRSGHDKRGRRRTIVPPALERSRWLHATKGS